MTDEPKDLASQITEAIKAVADVDESDPSAHNLRLRVKKADLANIIIENESITIAALSPDPIAERKQRDAEIAGLRAENERLRGERDNCAQLVKRLARALSLASQGDPPKLCEQAFDYLQRKGLQGSILREDENQ